MRLTDHAEGAVAIGRQVAEGPALGHVAVGRERRAHQRGEELAVGPGAARVEQVDSRHLGLTEGDRFADGARRRVRGRLGPPPQEVGPHDRPQICGPDLLDDRGADRRSARLGQAGQQDLDRVGVGGVGRQQSDFKPGAPAIGRLGRLTGLGQVAQLVGDGRTQPVRVHGLPGKADLGVQDLHVPSLRTFSPTTVPVP